MADGDVSVGDVSVGDCIIDYILRIVSILPIEYSSTLYAFLILAKRFLPMEMIRIIYTYYFSFYYRKVRCWIGPGTISTNSNQGNHYFLNTNNMLRVSVGRGPFLKVLPFYEFEIVFVDNEFRIRIMHEICEDDYDVHMYHEKDHSGKIAVLKLADECSSCFFPRQEGAVNCQNQFCLGNDEHTLIDLVL